MCSGPSEGLALPPWQLQGHRDKRPREKLPRNNLAVLITTSSTCSSPLSPTPIPSPLIITGRRRSASFKHTFPLSFAERLPPMRSNFPSPRSTPWVSRLLVLPQMCIKFLWFGGCWAGCGGCSGQHGGGSVCIRPIGLGARQTAMRLPQGI